jgi:energy-coupling factor transport system ATP-binding protein
MTEPAIALRACFYRYGASVPALRGITCTVDVGSWVSIVGQNGSGKTTLAKLCNGLLRPQAGTVRIMGEDIRGLPVGELARQVGYLFQNPDHQLFAPTVREEIAFGLDNLDFSPEEKARRIEQTLDTFDLQPCADRPPAVLGYGLRRQVTVASLFALRPPVLILDEPTTGLDAGRTELLMEHLRALHRTGHTIVLITHDMKLVAEWSERMIVLQEGQVLADGTPRAVFARSELLAQASLAPPPITELSQRLRPLGMRGDSPTVQAFYWEYSALSAPDGMESP